MNNMGQCYRERGLLMKSRDAFNGALTTLVEMHESLKPIPLDPEGHNQLLQPIPTVEWQNVGTGPGLDQALVSGPFGAHINVEHTAFWTLSNLYAVQVCLRYLHPIKHSVKHSIVNAFSQLTLLHNQSATPHTYLHCFSTHILPLPLLLLHLRVWHVIGVIWKKLNFCWKIKDSD